eukprot:980987-Prymnesium_polylepis.1
MAMVTPPSGTRASRGRERWICWPALAPTAASVSASRASTATRVTSRFPFRGRTTTTTATSGCTSSRRPSSERLLVCAR